MTAFCMRSLDAPISLPLWEILSPISIILIFFLLVMNLSKSPKGFESHIPLIPDSAFLCSFLTNDKRSQPRVRSRFYSTSTTFCNQTIFCRHEFNAIQLINVHATPYKRCFHATTKPFIKCNSSA